MVKGWTGTYEYNSYDQNGIIGPHPYYNNLYIVTGFSGQGKMKNTSIAFNYLNLTKIFIGIQQAPALGRAIAELIINGKFVTIDMTRLGFDRLIVDKPMYEIGPF